MFRRPRSRQVASWTLLDPLLPRRLDIQKATAATNELRLPTGVLVLLAAAPVFLLVTSALVLVPARVLPREVAENVEGRREQLVFIGLCARGVGLFLALLIAFVSS